MQNSADERTALKTTKQWKVKGGPLISQFGPSVSYLWLRRGGVSAVLFACPQPSKQTPHTVRLRQKTAEVSSRKLACHSVLPTIILSRFKKESRFRFLSSSPPHLFPSTQTTTYLYLHLIPPPTQPTPPSHFPFLPSVLLQSLFLFLCTFYPSTRCPILLSPSLPMAIQVPRRTLSAAGFLVRHTTTRSTRLLATPISLVESLRDSGLPPVFVTSGRKSLAMSLLVMSVSRRCCSVKSPTSPVVLESTFPSRFPLFLKISRCFLCFYVFMFFHHILSLFVIILYHFIISYHFIIIYHFIISLPEKRY
jgi:hypothetical protein